jgi:hypothetical protein
MTPDAPGLDMPPPASELDLRLVPGALTAWAVTAAGITFGVGFLLAGLSAVAALGWWAAGHRGGDRWPALRTSAAAVLGAAVVGAGTAAATEASGSVAAGRFGEEGAKGEECGKAGVHNGDGDGGGGRAAPVGALRATVRILHSPPA